jgi:very-short-patch-repair endonuclease
MFVCAQWGAVGEFAASRHGVLTRKQAAAAGLSRNVIARLIRTGHLSEPISNVLVVRGSVDTWHQRLTVATLASNGVPVAAFRSAAALHEFDGYRPGPVEVLVPTARPILTEVAIVHRGQLDVLDVDEVDGVRCTGIPRTLVNIAAVDPIQSVRRAFESVWRRGISLIWIEQTIDRLDPPGQRGIGVVRDLIQQAKDLQRPTESALELRLETCLQGIEGLVRQHQIFDSQGRFVARVDFAIPARLIAIEAHSRQFHFGQDAVSRDEIREHRLKALGWEVLYIGAKSMSAPVVVREHVLAIIGRRSAS